MFDLGMKTLWNTASNGIKEVVDSFKGIDDDFKYFGNKSDGKFLPEIKDIVYIPGMKSISNINNKMLDITKSLSKKGVDVYKGVKKIKEDADRIENDKLSRTYNVGLEGNLDTLNAYKEKTNTKEENTILSSEKEARIESERVETEKEVSILNTELAELKGLAKQKRDILETTMDCMPNRLQFRTEDVWKKVKDPKMRSHLKKLDRDLKETIYLLISSNYNKKILEMKKLMTDNKGIMNKAFNTGYKIEKKNLEKEINFFKKSKRIIKQMIENLVEIYLLNYIEEYTKNPSYYGTKSEYKNLFIYLKLSKPVLLKDIKNEVKQKIQILQTMQEW